MWTDERIELLKKLWAEGLSASQIAAQLGGVSRNAVIGKVHRIKLSGRGRSTANPARKKKTNPEGQKVVARAAADSRHVAALRHVTATVGATVLHTQFDAEPVVYYPIRPVEKLAVPTSRELQLSQLTERTCKWPNGDPLTEDFSFCGTDAAAPGPYCKYHSRLAFQPPAEKPRKRNYEKRELPASFY